MICKQNPRLRQFVILICCLLAGFVIFQMPISNSRQGIASLLGWHEGLTADELSSIGTIKLPPSFILMNGAHIGGGGTCTEILAKVQISKEDEDRLLSFLRSASGGAKNVDVEISRKDRLGILDHGPAWYVPDSVSEFIAFRLGYSNPKIVELQALIDNHDPRIYIAYIHYYTNE